MQKSSGCFWNGEKQVWIGLSDQKKGQIWFIWKEKKYLAVFEIVKKLVWIGFSNQKKGQIWFIWKE